MVLTGDVGVPRASSGRYFCKTDDNDLLIDHSRKQLSLAFPPEKTMFAVTENRLRCYEDALDSVPGGNIMVEPHDNGTTFAIMYSLMRLSASDPDATVVYFPADLRAHDAECIRAGVRHALEAERHLPGLILLGLAPRTPTDAREWIVPDVSAPIHETLNVWRVLRFSEAGSHSEATELSTRGGLVNSSVVVGNIPTFLRAVRAARPDLYDAFENIGPAIGTPGEAAKVAGIYNAEYPESDFARDVLASIAVDLAVVPVPAVKAKGVARRLPAAWSERTAAIGTLAAAAGA